MTNLKLSCDKINDYAKLEEINAEKIKKLSYLIKQYKLMIKKTQKTILNLKNY